MKIAVAGKGGVGKTTVSGTLCRVLGRQGKQVLAIDGDPNPNLSRVLGLADEKPQKALSTDILDRIEEADGTRKIIVKLPMDEVLETYGQRGPDNVHLLMVGKPEVAGGGCMCGSHTCVREVIHTAMTGQNTYYTVLDMEASMEHMKRGTARHVDTMLIVVEPYYRSLEAAGRFAELARDLGIKQVRIIANKVKDDRDAAAIRQFCDKYDLSIITTIPYDQQVVEADLQGVSIIDFDEDATLVRSIADVVSKLEAAV